MHILMYPLAYSILTRKPEVSYDKCNDGKNGLAYPVTAIVFSHSIQDHPMTNPTPTENERIALLRGWKCWPRPGPSAKVWRHKLSEEGYIYAPDFLHDWAHAGPLLEEMVDARYWSANIQSPVAGESWLLYMEEEGETLFHISGRGDTLTKAISRAWLVWKEEEA